MANKMSSVTTVDLQGNEPYTRVIVFFGEENTRISVDIYEPTEELVHLPTYVTDNGREIDGVVPLELCCRAFRAARSHLRENKIDAIMLVTDDNFHEHLDDLLTSVMWIDDPQVRLRLVMHLFDGAEGLVGHRVLMRCCAAALDGGIFEHEDNLLGKIHQDVDDDDDVSAIVVNAPGGRRMLS